MIGWAWDGIAPRSSASGLSDDEGQARRSAEAWLAENPGGAVRLGPAVLADINTTLSPWWAMSGEVTYSRVGEDGLVTWVRLPAMLPAPV